jgi:hypothetical protein
MRVPAKPSLNRGPVQIRARRALLVLGEATTTEISAWAHPRGGSRRKTDYTRRVLKRVADRIGRAPITPPCQIVPLACCESRRRA